MMLARLNYVLRALRCATRRKRHRHADLDLLSAEAVQASMLRARRAVGVAALVGAAGWVLLSDALVRLEAARVTRMPASAARQPALQLPPPACRPPLQRLA